MFRNFIFVLCAALLLGTTATGAFARGGSSGATFHVSHKVSPNLPGIHPLKPIKPVVLEAYPGAFNQSGFVHNAQSGTPGVTCSGWC